jgi:hypothetical protein
MRRVLSVLAFVAMFCLLSPRVSRASSITSTNSGMTLTLDTSDLSVVEGNPMVATFTLTNNTSMTITLQVFGGAADIPNNGYVSGDDTDGPTNAFLSNDGCRAAPLPNGATCTEAITYPTASPLDDTDADFGVFASGVAFGYGGGGCSTSPLPSQPCVGVNYTLTVYDPGFAAMPEPSSLLMLGAGLLGLGPLIRRLALQARS